MKNLALIAALLWLMLSAITALVVLNQEPSYDIGTTGGTVESSCVPDKDASIDCYTSLPRLRRESR